MSSLITVCQFTPFPQQNLSHLRPKPPKPSNAQFNSKQHRSEAAHDVLLKLQIELLSNKCFAFISILQIHSTATEVLSVPTHLTTLIPCVIPHTFFLNHFFSSILTTVPITRDPHTSQRGWGATPTLFPQRQHICGIFPVITPNDRLLL